MDLLFAFNQASFALGNEMAARLAEVGISPRQYCVLRTAREEELTQIRLAEKSMLDKTTMVVTLDELERAGLAERRPSPADRRARIVAVTDKGAAAVDAGRRIVEELQAELLASVPPELRPAFLEGLEALVGGPLASPSHVERAMRRPRERALVPN
ncbi:MarR family winged helix-turn-helix transcriptional regulator [Candidatus Solirubrobacter pratensis]|uniref:MarR family winged helix-turn-helix transcriptional regulator n=1 Tax=Candidatus Solirubrobacter pratensis TaxID=1298857 RepID=UPI000425FDB5|nr:MarR family transcriptional regulator [Candidatus Solirubrobacter pratensis]